MPLSNPRWESDPVLAQCLAGRRTLTIGDHGAAVKKVQEALLDLRYTLPIYGADASYGHETAQAVFKFKKDRNIRNASGQIDGIVGPKTMDRLDKDAPRSHGGGGGSTISPDMRIINATDMVRLGVLLKAANELERFKSKYGGGSPDVDDHVAKALQRQLLLDPGDNKNDYWQTVDTYLSFVRTNRLITRVPFFVDKADTSCFAHVKETNAPGDGIWFCKSFFEVNDQCRQEVITHEYFHFVVGLGHFYDAHTLDEAMRCPHHLAEAAFDIVLGHVSGCRHGVCTSD
jgi:Putative peptidoglycan binding domain